MRDAPTEEELERFKGWYESQTTPSPTQGYIPTDSIVRKPQPTPEQIDKYRAWHRRYMFATSPLERYKHSLEDNQAIETALLDELETILPGMTQRAEQGIVSAPGPAPSQRERSRLEQAIVNRTGREWKGPLGRELSDAELKVIERTNRIRKYGGLPSLVAYAEKEADIKEKFKQTGKLPMNRAIDSVFIAQLRAPFDILKQAGSELKGEQAPDPMTGFGMATLVGTPTPPGALAAGVKIPIKGKGTRQVGGLPTQTISEIAALISKNGPNKYHAVILENQFGVRIAGKSGQDVFRVRGPELPPEGVFASENQLAKYGITKPWVGKYEPELETAVQQSQRMRLHYSDEATKRDLLKPKSIQNVEKAITEKGVRPFTTDIRGGRQAESLAAFEYQNSIPERIVHLDWDKANSYRFELEGAGDVLRELTKSTPDPGYIGEKLNRTKRLLNALETGKLHPDDSIIAARKYEPDKLNNLIAAYEKQPIANPDQQMAKDLVLALAKGDYATARQLHTTLSTKLATPRDQLQHPSVRAAIKDLETQPTQAYKTPTAGEQNAMNTFREDQLKQLPPATGVVETKGGPSTTTLKAGDAETNAALRALTQRQGPKWYSPLEQALTTGKAGKFDIGNMPKASSLPSILEKGGVSRNELEYSGLLGKLAELGDQRVSRKELLKVVQAGKGKLESVGKPTVSGEPIVDIVPTSYKTVDGGKHVVQKAFTRPAIEPTYGPESHSTINLPGIIPGTYEERLFHYTPKGGMRYVEPHNWPGEQSTNMMAFTRGGDYKLPTGETAKHLQEVQSEWHKAGGKEGYAPANLQQKIDALTTEIAAAEKARVDFVTSTDYSISKPTPEQRAKLDVVYDRVQQLEQQRRLLRLSSGIADAPYKKDWYKLAFRDWVDTAIMEGKDAVTWSSGELLAKTYNKIADRFEWVKGKSANEYALTFHTPNGRELTQHYNSIEEIASSVGRRVAKIVQEQEAKTEYINTAEGRGFKQGGATGEFLVGSKFFEKLYDDDLVRFVKQEYGVQPEKVETSSKKGLNDDYDVVPISDRTRQSIDMNKIKVRSDFSIVNKAYHSFIKDYDAKTLKVSLLDKQKVRVGAYEQDMTKWRVIGLDGTNYGVVLSETPNSAMQQLHRRLLSDLNRVGDNVKQIERLEDANYVIIDRNSGEVVTRGFDSVPQAYGRTPHDAISRFQTVMNKLWEGEKSYIWKLPLLKSIKDRILTKGQRIAKVDTDALQQLRSALV